ncbi:AMP-binding protein [Devriesea agamarum]|uniref:AMP-binding protein n=1 Tax=Devriesea agamarum TaxID=472569 RepID=UPI00071C381E|nr:AMP-binding protein [Devriesea agamarum]
MTRIIPLNPPATEPLTDLLQRIQAIRSAGDIPLVGDTRWPKAQWEAIQKLAESAELPPNAAWATLTSGSSGFPRIVIRTDASWTDSFPLVSSLLEARAEDRIICPAPPSSSLTLFSLAHALDGSGPQPVSFSNLTRAACFHGTPQGLRALLKTPEPLSVHTAFVGGSHLDPDLRDEALARNIKVISYYGAAELSLVAYDDGTGMRPCPDVDLEIRDGQVWVRSPYIALGYLGEPGPLRIDGEWASVGDIGELNDGVLTLRGRSDGAIITASATVIPEEVETALRSLPGIDDAVVIGYPVPLVGELVSALIEPADIDLDQVRAASRPILAPASRPRIWQAGTIPRTAAGKPARAQALHQIRAKQEKRGGQ